MNPDDFFTRAEFEACDESERARYMIGLLASFGLARRRDDKDALLDVAKHYLDVLAWTLPPEEYDRIALTRLHGQAWDSAPGTKRELEGTDIPAADERELVQDLLESTRVVERLKQEPDDPPDG